MAQTPNPIEVYEASVQQMLPIVAGVKTDQLSSPTPCSEWNVQALINHNLRVQAFVNTVLIGAPGDISQIFDVVNEPIPTEGAEAVYTANTDAVLATIKSMSMETVLETAFGPMPAGNYLMIPFVDLVVHKWDLAKATNQSTDIDSGLAEDCLKYLKGLFQGGRLGPEFFADEVNIPSAASVQDQLLGIAGRQP